MISGFVSTVGPSQAVIKPGVGPSWGQW